LKQVRRVSGDCLIRAVSRGDNAFLSRKVLIPATLRRTSLLAVLPTKFERAEIAPRKPAVPTRETALPKVRDAGQAGELGLAHPRNTPQLQR